MHIDIQRKCKKEMEAVPDNATAFIHQNIKIYI